MYRLVFKGCCIPHEELGLCVGYDQLHASYPALTPGRRVAISRPITVSSDRVIGAWPGVTIPVTYYVQFSSVKLGIIFFLRSLYSKFSQDIFFLRSLYYSLVKS